MMGYNQDRILEALIDKRINYLKKSYLNLDSLLTNNQRSSIKKKIKSTTPDGFKRLLISYFKIYNINYSIPKPRLRTPETKENLINRQKKYIVAQEKKGKKKIQIYISDWEYKQLLNMKKTTKKTYSEIIGASISSHFNKFTSWSSSDNWSDL